MSPVTLGQKIGAGVFILLTIACWTFFNVKLTTKSIGKKYVVFFEESVRGLAPNSLVCYNGIPVGKVEKLENDFLNNRVKVKISITAEGIRIFSTKSKKTGTKAKLVTYMMTGLQYIDLYGLGDEDIKEGDTIPTIEDNMVKRIEGQFSSISKETKKFAIRLNEVLSPKNVEQLNQMLININNISENMAIATSPENPNGIPYRLNIILENASDIIGEKSEIKKILRNIAILTDPKKNGVRKLVHDMRIEIKRAGKSWNKLILKINDLIDSGGDKEDLTQTIREVNFLIRENRRSIAQIMTNLRDLSATTEKKLSQIAGNANKTIVTLNHFIQKELYQASAKMSLLFSELTNIVQIIKAKPNALLWGSQVRGK